MDLEAPMASLQLEEPQPLPEPPSEPPQESRRSLRLKYNLTKKVQHEPFYLNKRIKKQSPPLETIDEDCEVDYSKRKDCTRTIKRVKMDQFLWNKKIPKKEKIRRFLLQEKVPERF